LATAGVRTRGGWCRWVGSYAATRYTLFASGARGGASQSGADILVSVQEINSTTTALNASLRARCGTNNKATRTLTFQTAVGASTSSTVDISATIPDGTADVVFGSAGDRLGSAAAGCNTNRSSCTVVVSATGQLCAVEADIGTITATGSSTSIG